MRRMKGCNLEQGGPQRELFRIEIGAAAGHKASRGKVGPERRVGGPWKKHGRNWTRQPRRLAIDTRRPCRYTMI